MKKFLEVVKNKVFKVTKNKLQQNQRNDLKSDLIQALMDYLPEEIVTGRAKEGIILEFENNELGSIVGVLDVTIKPIDFDVMTPIDEYKQKQLEKIEQEKKKQKKIQKDTERRQKEKEE